MLFLLTSCRSFAGPAPLGPNPVLGEPPPRRTIHFPRDRSMGKVYICPWDTLKKEFSLESSWTEWAEAKGDVEIPKGHGAALMCLPDLEEEGDNSLDLSPLDGLDPLDLQGFFTVFTRIEAKELERLTRFTKLVFFQVGFTELEEGCLPVLGRLKHLTMLSLPELDDLDDDGLRHIGKLKYLEVLNLYGTGVTDAGLKHLWELNRLQWLDLRRTRVTGEEFEKTRQKLPHLKFAVWGTY